MNVSICLDKQEQYKAAEINYREVLNGGQKKLELHHPYTLRIMNAWRTCSGCKDKMTEQNTLLTIF